MLTAEEKYAMMVYEKQTEEDYTQGWSCYTDIANATSPDYFESTLRGNWAEDINERSGEPEFRAVGVKNVFYKPGSALKIQINGTQKFKDDVKAVLTNNAQPYINLKFNFVDSGGNVVIDNNYKGGGVTRCLGCQSPSISISSAEVGLVLHEFGHALGMHHEMKNPNIKLTWNQSVLLKQYGNKLQFVNSQILEKLPAKDVTATAFDKNSVMIYPLPASTNAEGIAMGGVNKYTDLDRQWLETTYGKPSQPPPPISSPSVPQPTPGKPPQPTPGKPPQPTPGKPPQPTTPSKPPQPTTPSKPPQPTTPSKPPPPPQPTTPSKPPPPPIDIKPSFADKIINIFISLLTGE